MNASPSADLALAPGFCLVLGASSGFGAAAARHFAAAGLDVAGVHLDLKGTRHLAEEVAKDVEARGRRALFFNVNAADPEKRSRVVEALREACGEGPGVRVLLHSLAFGSLRPLAGAEGELASATQLAMTLDVMATSLVGWVQAVQAAGLLERGGRVFAMTSEGSQRAWPGYGPISAAKGALESLIRQLALELAPLEVTANAICAGFADTPASARIPGRDALRAEALRRNPRGRLTRPDDVAQALVALATPACGWISGNVIRIDGGEGITG
jgi:NAD(P)-dependent dehydrogenase (short-subunit alcohol dehydrogenase family)